MIIIIVQFNFFATYAELQGGLETLYSINITLNYEYYIYVVVKIKFR